MKKFILFSVELEESQKETIKNLIIEHGGQESGEYLEINDKSFKEVSKIIAVNPYNVVSESKQATHIMTLGKQKPTPPIDPTFQEEMREFKDDMLEFKKDMLDFKSEMVEFKNEMMDFKNEMLGFKTIVLAFIIEQKKFNEEQKAFNKTIVGRLDNLVAKNNLVE